MKGGAVRIILADRVLTVGGTLFRSIVYSFIFAITKRYHSRDSGQNKHVSRDPKIGREDSIRYIANEAIQYNS